MTFRAPRVRTSFSSSPRRTDRERLPRLEARSLLEALDAFRPKRLTVEEREQEHERELARFFDTGPKQ